ncbi:MAG: SPFH domain-containing protein [Promethearchaeota archaeon]
MDLIREAPKGLKPGIFEKLLGKNITIAEMDHDLDNDEGILNKRLIYRLKLHGKDEISGTNESDFVSEKEYLNFKNKLKKLEEEKALVGISFLKKRDLKRDIKRKELEDEINNIKKKMENLAVQVTAFSVKEFERALFFKFGQLIDEVPPGLWELKKEYQGLGSEIVWVDMTQFKIKWGASDILTRDFVKVGAHGILIFKVKDPKKLVINLISSKKVVTQDEIERFIWDTVISVIKHECQEYNVEELIREREKLEMAIRARMRDNLDSWGLELLNFEVLNVKLPDDLEDHFSEKVKSRLELEKKALMKQKIEHDAELNKEELLTHKELEILKTEKEIELEKKRIELEKQRKMLELEDAKLQVEKTRILKERASIEREIQAENKLKDIELKEKEGLTNATIKKASIEAARDIREHEKSLKQLEITNHDEIKEQIKDLEAHVREKEAELSKIDKLMIEDKINKDIYNKRVDMILKDVKRYKDEILYLKNKQYKTI